jgi:cellulose synthase/poly-beta-1,6-N-acetylglucosamine synthase-like glycosyltransferase
LSHGIAIISFSVGVKILFAALMMSLRFVLMAISSSGWITDHEDSYYFNFINRWDYSADRKNDSGYSGCVIVLQACEKPSA